MNITVDRAVIEQALEALDEIIKWYGARDKADVLMAPHNQNPEIKQAMELVPALRTALEQPDPEPVAWMYINTDGECEQIEYIEFQAMPDDPSITPLYTAPPQRKPLSDEEIADAVHEINFPSITAIARAIEAAHGIRD